MNISKVERSQSVDRWIERTRGTQLKIFNARLTILLVTLVLLTLFVVLHHGEISALVLAIALTCFFLFWRASGRVQGFLSDLLELKAYYARMEARMRGQSISAFSVDQNHTPRERDLDLVGELSVLSRISECFSEEGRAQLRLLLNQESQDQEGRSRRIRLWSTMLQTTGVWRRWLIKGHRNTSEFGGRWNWAVILESVRDSFLPDKTRALVFAAAGFNLAFWIRGIYEMQNHLGPQISLGLIIVFWVLSVLALSQTGNGYSRALGVEARLAPLSRLSLESARALKNGTELQTEFKIAASDVVGRATQKMALACTLLSVASHPLVFIFLNALVPWTLIGCLVAERARRELKAAIATAATEWEELEVLASFAMTAHESGATAARIENAHQVYADQLLHPLLKHASAVGADVRWDSDVRIVILSGSNMAGKSTFLRALAINFQLAQIGAPVFAKKFSCFAGRLMSSIRTSDSLGEGASYFYAEVQRIKDIVESVKSKASVLYVIDEMFRGTNTRERVSGCSQILSAVGAETASLGVVATHDLELADLALPGLVNYHFREDVEGDRMAFSYRLEEGICPTTNALRVMRQMGLPVTLNP